MILRVGLTGGLASGKSTVAKILEQHGCRVIDADRVVRELYEPGAPGHQALVERYGPSILTADGSIDRVRLSEIALSTEDGARALNRLIHPLVGDRIDALLESIEREETEQIVVVEATLLLEAGTRDRYDRIVVADADPEVRLARAVARGLAPEEARRRMERQSPRGRLLEAADYVVDTQGDLRHTETETLEVLRRLRADLAAKRDGA